ncbi:phosphotransferase [Mycolicibacterium arabiense]|uniref:Phosphotransferase n=2 Tax=Mycolicibacterium arabiense TaxID=1286181 RepID=A0A7I7RX84_9MYCO|nr:phosphotransferase [Mycolicibacterium arabiense]
MAMRAARLGAHLAHGAGRIALDSALGGWRRFPRRVTDLTPDVLSRVLGRPVESASVVDAESGTSSRARLALTGPDLPDTVFVKVSAATAATRMLGELARLGETEARFYRDLAHELGDGVPRSYGAAFDPLTGRYVVVLEDMTVTPCRFADTLHPLEVDQMAQLMEVLAKLHGSFWGRLPEKPGGASPLGWITAPASDPANLLTPALMKASARTLADRAGVPIDAGRWLWRNFQRATDVVDEGPHTVLHGDSHPGNTYVRDGRAGLLDWQVVRRGHPSRDLTYTLVLGLPVEQRRCAERDLLDVYRDGLEAAGGPRLDRENLWLRYRQAVTYAFVSPLTTAGLGGMQDEAVALEGLSRAVAAIEDLETVSALQRAR